MRLAVLALVALSATAACRPPESAAPAPHSAYRGPLVSSLQVEAEGDSVRLVLQVTNGANEALTVGFTSGQSYDFAILDGAETVWSWSADRSFIQAVRSERLAGGETRTYSETWRVPAGLRGRTLTAVGRLTSSDHPVERRTEFRVQ